VCVLVVGIVAYVVCVVLGDGVIVCVGTGLVFGLGAVDVGVEVVDDVVGAIGGVGIGIGVRIDVGVVGAVGVTGIVGNGVAGVDF
jgi:hypothetical protein